MKLAKALKEKNRLAGEAGRLKELLKEQNCRVAQQSFDYDNRAVLRDLFAVQERLVAVKTSIARANARVHDKIFRMAELKGLVALYRALNVSEGVFVEGGGYGEPKIQREYRAQLKKTDVDKLAADADAEIQRLQDELDEFNFTVSVEA